MEDALVIVDCAFQPVCLGAPSGPAGVALADEMRRQRGLVDLALPPDSTGSGSENVFTSTQGPTPPVLQDAAADVSVYHSLVMRGSFLRGPVAVEDGATLRNLHGKRVILFGATTIIHVGQALVDIAAQHEAYGITGVALFPSSLTSGGRSAVTREGLQSVFTGIAEMGIRHVSIYQAPSASLVETNLPAEVRLLDAVAPNFPDMVLQVVAGDVQGARIAGGLAARHPNLYVNLQGVFSLLITRPREFSELLASLAADAGYDKLLFASGWSVTRPRALIEAFRSLELSAELSAGYRLPPLDARAKAAILGDTAARLLELSPN